MTGASKSVNEQATGPVLTSRFLVVLYHSGKEREERECYEKKRVCRERKVGRKMEQWPKMRHLGRGDNIMTDTAKEEGEGEGEEKEEEEEKEGKDD